MRPVYIESELEFRFPRHWAIRKYDQQKFYLQISGLGLKGVDFLIIDPGGEGHLYLIEVKNYRTRNHEGGTFIPSLKDPPAMAAIVAAKYEHTIRAIGAIQVYYQRKWWYRFCYNYYLKSNAYQKDPVFWATVHRLAQNNEQHTLLLWLEADSITPSYSKALDIALNYELPTGVAVTVASVSQPYPSGIMVREVEV